MPAAFPPISNVNADLNVVSLCPLSDALRCNAPPPPPPSALEPNESNVNHPRVPDSQESPLFPSLAPLVLCLRSRAPSIIILPTPDWVAVGRLRLETKRVDRIGIGCHPLRPSVPLDNADAAPCHATVLYLLITFPVPPSIQSIRSSPQSNPSSSSVKEGKGDWLRTWGFGQPLPVFRGRKINSLLRRSRLRSGNLLSSRPSSPS